MISFFFVLPWYSCAAYPFVSVKTKLYTQWMPRQYFLKPVCAMFPKNGKGYDFMQITPNTSLTLAMDYDIFSASAYGMVVKKLQQSA
jgi:hypothetical protein